MNLSHIIEADILDSPLAQLMGQCAGNPFCIAVNGRKSNDDTFLFRHIFCPVKVFFNNVFDGCRRTEYDTVERADIIDGKARCFFEDIDDLGTKFADYIDYTAFAKGVFPALGFSSDTVTEYEYENGNCSMTRPAVTVLKGDGFGLTLRYTAIFPITWNGNTYSNLEVPVTVSSYYKSK